MGIKFDDKGRLTVPAAWFRLPDDDQNPGGKIQATPDGQVKGLLVETGANGRGDLAKAIQNFNPNDMNISDYEQGLIVAADTDEQIAVASLPYGPAHFDGLQMARPENQMILATIHRVPRGIYVAGSVHPEAVVKYGSLGDCVGRINATPWSMEGAREPKGRFRFTLGHKATQVAKNAVAVAVGRPGLPVRALAAADVDDDGQPVTTIEINDDLRQVVAELVAAQLAERDEQAERDARLKNLFG